MTSSPPRVVADSYFARLREADPFPLITTSYVENRFPMLVLLPVHPGFDDHIADPRILEVATRVGQRLGLTPPVPIAEYRG